MNRFELPDPLSCHVLACGAPLELEMRYTDRPDQRELSNELAEQHALQLERMQAAAQAAGHALWDGAVVRLAGWEPMGPTGARLFCERGSYFRSMASSMTLVQGLLLQRQTPAAADWSHPALSAALSLDALVRTCDGYFLYSRRAAGLSEAGKIMIGLGESLDPDHDRHPQDETRICLDSAARRGMSEEFAVETSHMSWEPLGLLANPASFHVGFCGMVDVSLTAHQLRQRLAQAPDGWEHAQLKFARFDPRTGARLLATATGFTQFAPLTLCLALERVYGQAAVKRELSLAFAAQR